MHAVPCLSWCSVTGSFVLCLCDGTRIEPLKPPLPSASTPPIIHLLVSHCRLRILRVRFGFFLILHVWSGLHRYDGWTRTFRPCFTCLPLRFALGTVRGPSNCSLVVFSNGSSDFDAGPVFNIYALVSWNLSAVYEIVMLTKLQSFPYGCAWSFIVLLSFFGCSIRHHCFVNWPSDLDTLGLDSWKANVSSCFIIR